jgi:16S rRNA (cytosine1402-N4)-methyltransferase
MEYHVPVLLEASLNGLNIKENGVYVDVTYGGGGHSKAILERLGKQGKLIAFDRDGEAHNQAIEDERIVFVKANYRYISKFLKLNGVTKIDGLLADLGVSSHQFDEAKRGFSFRFSSDLDMRMDSDSPLSAYQVINDYPKVQLASVLFQYGEVINANRLADEIIKAREIAPVKTTSQLIGIADKCLMGNRNKYLAQVFQAIRIEVNEELDSLKEMLVQTKDLLSSGGRLVVISYHSLEDRMVKNFMRYGNMLGEPIKDMMGREDKVFKVLTKKPIEADEQELSENSRSRSARLRIAEKL